MKVQADRNLIDTVTMDVPLLVRLLELAREDLKSDVELHVVVERILRASKTSQVLTMADYPRFVKQKQEYTVKVLKAKARLERIAAHKQVASRYATYVANVKDLASRIFGEGITFDPSTPDPMIAHGEPLLFVDVGKDFRMQQVLYFSKALDRSPEKYNVNYVLPDIDKGKHVIRVTFVK